MGSCSYKASHMNQPIFKVQSEIRKKRKNPSSLGLTPLTNSNINQDIKPNFSYNFHVEGVFPAINEDAFVEKIINFKENLSKEFFEESKIGVTCRKGLKAGHNQDNFAVISKNSVLVAAVFDGHGDNGHHIASIARKFLPDFLVNDPLIFSDPFESIKRNFEKTRVKLEENCQKHSINLEKSGSTATVALIINKRLLLSHLGDSRAILVKTFGKELIAMPLTIDHNAENPVEKAKIQRSGGVIRKNCKDDCERVFVQNDNSQGLCVTRAFGDLMFSQAGINSVPEIYETEISENDNFLVICSDGVWQVLGNYEVAKIVMEKNQSEVACKTIADVAWKKWIENNEEYVDDITIIVVPLNLFR